MRRTSLAVLGFSLNTFAYAATITVTTTSDQIADTGTCSLREAIIAANTNAPSGAVTGECPSGNSGAPDTVLLPAGTYALSRNGSDNTAIGGDLDLTQTIALEGAGRDLTIIDAAAIGERVLHVLISPGAVTISKMTIRHGSTTGSGGGILLSDADSASLVDVRITANTADDNGGGIAILSIPTTVLTRISVDDNQAIWDGGGIYLSGGTLQVVDSQIYANQTLGSQGAGGGICIQEGSVSLNQSTLAENVTGTSGGGIYVVWGDVQVSEATFESNSADQAGGGLYFSSSSESSSLANSTISGNVAGVAGGGIATSSWGTGSITLTHVTVASNTAATGSALDAISISTRNSLLSGTCTESVATSLGGNIESPGDNCGFTHATDQTAVSASALGLGALAFNGGSTRTIMPSASSVALNTARSTYCTPTDQRGTPRPQDPACDVGAVERVAGWLFSGGFEEGDLGAWSSHVP